jgi:hypothetical protein
MPDSTLCPAAIVPLTANMQNWKSTDSTGLRRKMIQSVHGYNFGKGSRALYRQISGPKQMAASVRCIKD